MFWEIYENYIVSLYSSFDNPDTVSGASRYTAIIYHLVREGVYHISSKTIHDRIYLEVDSILDILDKLGSCGKCIVVHLSAIFFVLEKHCLVNTWSANPPTQTRIYQIKNCKNIFVYCTARANVTP